jgi:hypothetical protein
LHTDNGDAGKEDDKGTHYFKRESFYERFCVDHLGGTPVVIYDREVCQLKLQHDATNAEKINLTWVGTKERLVRLMTGCYRYLLPGYGSANGNA